MLILGGLLINKENDDINTTSNTDTLEQMRRMIEEAKNNLKIRKSNDSNKIEVNTNDSNSKKDLDEYAADFSDGSSSNSDDEEEKLGTPKTKNRVTKDMSPSTIKRPIKHVAYVSRKKDRNTQVQPQFNPLQHENMLRKAYDKTRLEKKQFEIKRSMSKIDLPKTNALVSQNNLMPNVKIRNIDNKKLLKDKLDNLNLELNLTDVCCKRKFNEISDEDVTDIISNTNMNTSSLVSYLVLPLLILLFKYLTNA